MSSHQGEFDDVGLSYLLLGGTIDSDEKGLPLPIYFEPKSNRKNGNKLDDALEIEARRAIARLLRAQNPLDNQVRLMLAALFDPRPNTDPGGERRITFEFRSRGNRTSAIRNTMVVNTIWQKVVLGLTVNQAIDQSIEKLGIERRQLMSLWRRYRPLFERIHGPISRPSRRKPR